MSSATIFDFYWSTQVFQYKYYIQNFDVPTKAFEFDLIYLDKSNDRACSQMIYFSSFAYFKWVIHTHQGILVVKTLRSLFFQHYAITLFLSGTSPRGFRCDYVVGHVHNAGINQQIFATCGLHEGHRCLEWTLCLLRLLCSVGICTCELCFKVGMTKVPYLPVCFFTFSKTFYPQI